MKKRIYFFSSCCAWLSLMAGLAALGPIGRNVHLFALLYAAGFIAAFFIFRFFPRYASKHKALIFIVCLGSIARLLFALHYPPSNDVNRYVWEGHIQNKGVNPYVFSPLDPGIRHLAEEELHGVWSGVNHKEYAACYPPLPLIVFRLLSSVSPDPRLFKFFFFVIDILLMIVLARIIICRNAQPNRLLFYAANPLPILFISGEGHLDVLQAFFLMTAVWLFLQKKPAIGFLTMGAAAVAMYFAAVAIPFFLNAKNWKKGAAALIPLLLFLPYLEAGPGLFASLGSFGTDMHYNDSIAAILRYLFDSHSTLISAALFCIWSLGVYATEHDKPRSLYLVLGGLLICLPNLHPGLLVVICPFLVLYPSRAWLYLCAGVAFTFPVIAADWKTGIFQEMTHLKIVEYTPFFVLLIHSLFRDGLIVRDAFFRKPRNISVVIPALNEIDNIEQCIHCLEKQETGFLKEIIVADGGSTDGTAELADRKGADIITAEKGRGQQVQQALKFVSADAVLVLHADCRLKNGALKAVIDALCRHPHSPGGALGMSFKDKSIGVSIISGLNNFRARFFKIAFGDQAQFFRMEALSKMGGFPPIMLMEDVELSYRLKNMGPLLYIPSGVRVSSRRWISDGITCNAFVVLALFFRYILNRRFFGSELDTKQKYYQKYYGTRSGREK